MNENILNPDIYKKAVEKGKEVYKKHSAYRSMYIQKVYKEMGGKYKGKKEKEGVSRWNKEKWIQVKPFLTSGKKIECGEDNKKNKVCRPFVRVNKQTPITLPELLELHSKKDLLSLTNKKLKDMEGRVFWKTLKYYPSK